MHLYIANINVYVAITVLATKICTLRAKCNRQEKAIQYPRTTTTITTKPFHSQSVC